MVWKQLFHNPASTVSSASTILFQWQQVQSSQVCSVLLNHSERVITWQRPILGWYTCNVDAMVYSEDHHSSFGCLLRDENEAFTAGYRGNFWDIIDPKIAEAMAFREAFSWLKNLAITNVFIELDSVGVVQAFRNNSKDNSFLGSIIKGCWTLCKEFKILLSLFHVAAHTIARVANSSSDHE